MITSIIVSGEGRTDIGGSHSGQAIATGVDFEKGPMYILIERMLARFVPDWNADLWETNPLEVSYVSHGFLKRKAKERAKGNGKFTFASKTLHQEHNGKYKHTRELAGLATERGCQLAVYFIDTDGRNEDKDDSSQLQQKIVQALNEGYIKGGFNGGVAMVPKPTSEAWLICHCQTSPYANCSILETRLSGNDNCPDENSPKKELERFIGVGYDDALVFDKVETLDIDQLDMPSFNRFKDDLKSAIAATGLQVKD
ncbi:hypothetical protein [Vibrio splendidus]|uniref:hypothetical protein n=1 Tax=Vibrio splendidus TaxID=29497 RepID=UPI0006CA483E|nr:hypothetical protein [Vibrio splendidus]KPM01486.1 hypothetical protein AN167_02940 [Vibrio splendidus]